MVSTTDIPNSQSGITQKLKMSRAANHSGVSKLMFGFCVLVAVTIFVQETTALTIAVPETEQVRSKSFPPLNLKNLIFTTEN